MSDDAWDAWLAAVADPERGARVEMSGLVRARRWDMGVRRLGVHMLHYVVGGGQVGRVAGAPVRTRRDAVLWVPAGVEQDLRAAPGPAGLAKYFVRFALDAPPPPGEPSVREDVGAAYPLFARVYAEGAARLPGRDASLRALLVLIFNEWRRAASASGAVLAAADRDRLLAIVDGDPRARPHPERLARELGLSATSFARRFRRTFGVAPRRWLMERRIRRAAQRLAESRLAIGAVAAEFGYADLFLFSRQFRAVMGVAPSAWRDDPR